jgi:hypothetical protein
LKGRLRVDVGKGTRAKAENGQSAADEKGGARKKVLSRF